MQENELAKIIVNTAFKIHSELGPGLFESVYESVLEYELSVASGLHIRRQPTLRLSGKRYILILGLNQI